MKSTYNMPGAILGSEDTKTKKDLQTPQQSALDN